MTSNDSTDLNLPNVPCFGVVPAAGLSRRMGRDKLTMAWKGKPLFEHIKSAWLASRIDRLVITVRSDHEELISLCNNDRIDLVKTNHPTADMRASVELALRFIERTYHPRPDSNWLLSPADTPLLTSQIINQVIDYPSQFPSIVVPVLPRPNSQNNRQSGDSRRGHPVRMSWQYVSKIFALRKDQGINALMRRHAINELIVEDSSILFDLDFPEDFEALTKKTDRS